MITLDRARTIAYAWHGGQSSPLYNFASTGAIHSESHLRGLELEIRDALKYAESQNQRADIRSLNALLRVVRAGREFED